jgi:hypothetical protein
MKTACRGPVRGRKVRFSSSAQLVNIVCSERSRQTLVPIRIKWEAWLQKLSVGLRKLRLDTEFVLFASTVKESVKRLEYGQMYRRSSRKCLRRSLVYYVTDESSRVLAEDGTNSALP